MIFDRRAALDALGERLLDANRTVGQPTKLATIFGRKATKRYRGKLETVIEDLDLPNRLASLRYDLSKLRAKGLVEKVPHSRRYRLDHLYQQIVTDLDALLQAVGLKTAA